MSSLALREHLVNGGHIDCIGKLYRLTIPATGADAYVDAQLDDYEHVLPHRFTNRPPFTLTLRARFSQQHMKGTAGFGFWNHPFSREGAVINPPSNAWFFYSSPESDLQVARGMPGHGFKASMLNGGRMPRVIVTVGSTVFNLLLHIPLISKLSMWVARKAVNASEAMLAVDMTEWHVYKLIWLPDVATFYLDGKVVLCASHPPNTPLGFAAWIDNYRASAGGSRYQFAYVSVAQEQWMEVEIIGADE